MSVRLRPLQALKLWQEVGLTMVRRHGVDLTQRQMVVLLTIYLEPPPHTVRGLALKLGVTKPVITRALDAMGYEGPVALQVLDRADFVQGFALDHQGGDLGPPKLLGRAEPTLPRHQDPLEVFVSILGLCQDDRLQQAVGIDRLGQLLQGLGVDARAVLLIGRDLDALDRGRDRSHGVGLLVVAGC